MNYWCMIAVVLWSQVVLAQAVNVPFAKPPGESFKGELPKLTDEEKTLADRLKLHVEKLASEIGFRNIENPKGLEQSIAYLTKTMSDFGYEIKPQTYTLNRVDCSNLIAEIKGTEKPDEIVIVGAHYDSVQGSPAANDNASGVAAVVEIARTFKDIKPKRTIRFVFFVNEEPQNFQRESMGAWYMPNPVLRRKRRSLR